MHLVHHSPTLSTECSHNRWMIEAIVVDPFDSNRWIYDTSATIQGGCDSLKWDTIRNIKPHSRRPQA